MTTNRGTLRATALAILLLLGAAAPAPPSALADAAADDEGTSGGTAPRTLASSGSGASAALDGPEGDNLWFNGTVRVTLSAGSDPVIKYRVDDGDWEVYVSPFDVSGNSRRHTVTFGSDADLTSDRLGKAEFGIDAEAPFTKINLTAVGKKYREGARHGDAGENEDGSYDTDHPGQNHPGGNGNHIGFFKGATLVRLRGTDNHSGVRETAYRVDGGGWQAYKTPFVVSGDGNHTVHYYSTDYAGIVEPVRKLEWGVDPKQPETNGTVEDPGTPTNGTDDGVDPSWHTDNVTFNVEASDDVSGVSVIRVSRDDGDFENFTGPESLGDGVHVRTYTAIDAAGNVAFAEDLTIKVDTTPPAIDSWVNGTPGDNGWYRGPVTVDLVGRDSVSGVLNVKYGLDGAALEPYVDEVTVTPEGAHTLLARAVDLAGNVQKRSLSVRIDHTSPVSSATLDGRQGSGGWFVGSASVTIDATDGVSGVALRQFGLDGAPLGTYSSAFTVETDGQHVLSYRSRDKAGNVESTRTLRFDVDSLAPTTTITADGTVAAPDGVLPTNDTTPTLTLSATDTVSGVNATHFSVDGGATWRYEGPFNVTGEGNHLVRFWSTDLAAHVETAHTVTVCIDSTPPTSNASVNGTEGEAGWFVSAARVTLEAEDDGCGVSRIEYAVDDGPVRKYESPFSLGSGDHAVTYYAVDRAGNREAAKVIRVPVDTDVPRSTAALTGTSGSSGWYTSNVTVDVTATDPVSGVSATYARIGDGDEFLVTGPFLVTESGITTVRYRSVDVAGNEEAERSVEVRIDRVAPVTEATWVGVNPGNSPNYLGGVAVTLTAEDETSGVKYTYYRIDGGMWKFYNTQPIVVREPGRHVLEFLSQDHAGLREGTHRVSFHVVTPGFD